MGTQQSAAAKKLLPEVRSSTAARKAPPLPSHKDPIFLRNNNSNNNNKKKKPWKTQQNNPTPCYAVFDNGQLTCRSEDPTLVWDHILSQSKAKCLQVTDVVQPQPAIAEEWDRSKVLRVVCISDTHGKHRKMTQSIPDGDVLIHAGDFTNVGHTKQVQDVCEWMSELPHTYKLLIAGNHDVTLDEDYYTRSWQRWHHKGKNDDVAARRIVRETKGITYLEDESCLIEGYHFYGSPWQPEFCDWAYNLSRGQACVDVWDKIPTKTDILITHGPPVGHGDATTSGQRAGCVNLLSTVTERVRPLYHIFGHIHESYGVTTNGTTTFINASTCTFSYRPNNPPVVFDLPRKVTEVTEVTEPLDPVTNVHTKKVHHILTSLPGASEVKLK